MVRAFLLGLALFASASANRVVSVDLPSISSSNQPMQVCYEDRSEHTVVRYTRPDSLVYILDAEKTGVLDSPRDRVLSINSSRVHKYYHDGYLHSRVSQGSDGPVRGPEIFLGAIYRQGEMVLETELDRSGYRIAQERFRLESEMLSLIESALEDVGSSPLASCDPLDLLHRF